MLFSKIFNWVKYKTLPPSILFSNRLFVERDSKHRRVTSNLGLTFRNSKWSTYARSNINIGHQSSYFNLLAKVAGFVIFAFAVTSFSSYYNVRFASEFYYAALWFLFDAELYLKVMFSSSIFCLLQLLSSSVQAQFIGTTSSSQEAAAPSSLGTEAAIPKSLHKPILRKWLTSSSSGSDLSHLFSTTSERSGSSTSNLFPSLYRTSYLLRQDSVLSSDLQSRVFGMADAESRRYSDVLNLNLRPENTTSGITSSFIDYTVFGSRTETSPTNPNTEFSNWSLSSVTTETGLYPSTLRTATGLFYLNEYSTAALNTQALNMPELSSVRNSADQQLSVIRWQRWLYKYNILHRALLKNSTYITHVNKLLSSGFYSDSATTRNIWNSQYFTEDGLMSSQNRDLYSSLYGNYMGNAGNPSAISSSTTAPLNSSSIFSLGYYNLSYQWFIQRFYQFNTLESNGAYYSPRPSSQSSSHVLAEVSEAANRSVLFDTDASTALTALATTTSSAPAGTHSPSNLYLNYSDTLFFSQARVESLKNLSGSRSASNVVFYSPKTLGGVSVK